MNYIKSLLAAALVMCFVSTISFAQEKEMMKKDSMKTKMMKDDMKKDMMKDNMKSKEMMHDDVMMKIYKTKEGIAIKGYDPVAYFTESKAVMGDKMFSYKWSGADWHFTNEKHLSMFKENPEKYAPCYGGFCAYGVSDDHLSSTDPTAWTIVDGKLYLNYNTGVKKLFNKKLNENIMKAEKNWPGLNKDGM